MKYLKPAADDSVSGVRGYFSHPPHSLHTGRDGSTELGNGCSGVEPGQAMPLVLMEPGILTCLCLSHSSPLSSPSVFIRG
jgi:hypothetical protein